MSKPDRMLVELKLVGVRPIFFVCPRTTVGDALTTLIKVNLKSVNHSQLTPTVTSLIVWAHGQAIAEGVIQDLQTCRFQRNPQEYVAVHIYGFDMCDVEA
ncbi:hypothetical protein [Burkholderia sp. JKS000303]|uniref:hypothetical protein n=1 Tax=Burkholderia sp. JKS000303 TaxID=1938747 RepID=UPI000BF8B7BB|nr:hypothetical protein [Burkholderia sp. JKS000303]PFH12882.1 hypothetical protein BX604_7302 [Burkholderia sp. JKS000303]